MTRVYEGDCLDVMRQLAREGVRVDSLVSDTPYHLKSITARFGGRNAAPAQHGRDGAFGRLSRGFMGREWDGGTVSQNPEVWSAAYRLLRPGGWLLAMSATRTQHRMVCAIEDAGFEIRDMIGWMYGQGWAKNRVLPGRQSVGLTPAWEPICVARKPLGEKTVLANIARHGVGALNVGECWIYGDDPEGRFPKNLIIDGSNVVRALFPDSKGQQGDGRGTEPSELTPNGIYGRYAERLPAARRIEEDPSAARFFYCAKATAAERAFSHPTVKPVALMRYLVRLVTPVGGITLDPFAGTGQTGHAALLEGRHAILIEKEPEYAEGLRRRFEGRRLRRAV